MVSPNSQVVYQKCLLFFFIYLGRYVVIQNFVKTQKPQVLTLCEVEITGGGFSMSCIMLKHA